MSQQTTTRYKQPKQSQSILPPKYTSRAIMLAIEFDENPNDRFYLPKHSILEYIDSTHEVLWSFIHLNDNIYTPVTFKFGGIPRGVYEIMAKCIRPKDIVQYKMKQVLSQYKRSEYMNIWFQIEKQDEILIDLIRKEQLQISTAEAQVHKKGFISVD
ncbi:hypothetical protein FF38_13799 [Lucilia cuprina]|uniref:Swc3 C-terminal domain-containing protein n=1 Tax=Lucilia cuprina TaxID=7375 RepID=A0A0L0CMQ4_LUCCU|nr:hypothetical protein FF38_13799 [Lucilia cuprina]